MRNSVILVYIISRLMELNLFLVLDKEEQLQLLQQEGILLADRFQEASRYFLFGLFGFYLELKYAPWADQRSQLSVIRVFEDTGPLDPYLESISLENLLPVI